jgi:hypothetical protein
MLTPADIQLGALLGHGFATRLEGRHILRAALRSHLAAAFIFARAQQLLRHETRKAWRHEEDQRNCHSPKSCSHPH